MIATTPPPAYVVQAGDTLWSISARELGSPLKWPALWQANSGLVADPNLIFPGQRLVISPLTWRPLREVSNDLDTQAVALPASDPAGPPAGGTLGCADLQTLWVSAGGPRGVAFLAAEIAMAESGGQQYATGAAGERGYWQINPDHGTLSTYDAYGNARAAVLISGYGRDFTPWTTYLTGAYLGRC